MITAAIFTSHFIFILIIFTNKWQKEGIFQAWINVGLIVTLFAVGWTITGMIAKLIMGKEVFGFYFDRDTFSLALLTIIESFFYRFYYKSLPTEDDKETQ